MKAASASWMLLVACLLAANAAFAASGASFNPLVKYGADGIPFTPDDPLHVHGSYTNVVPFVIACAVRDQGNPSAEIFYFTIGAFSPSDGSVVLYPMVPSGADEWQEDFYAGPLRTLPADVWDGGDDVLVFVGRIGYLDWWGDKHTPAVRFTPSLLPDVDSHMPPGVELLDTRLQKLKLRCDFVELWNIRKNCTKTCSANNIRLKGVGALVEADIPLLPHIKKWFDEKVDVLGLDLDEIVQGLIDSFFGVDEWSKWSSLDNPRLNLSFPFDISRRTADMLRSGTIDLNGGGAFVDFTSFLFGAAKNDKTIEDVSSPDDSWPRLIYHGMRYWYYGLRHVFDPYAAPCSPEGWDASWRVYDLITDKSLTPSPDDALPLKRWPPPNWNAGKAWLRIGAAAVGYYPDEGTPPSRGAPDKTWYCLASLCPFRNASGEPDDRMSVVVYLCQLQAAMKLGARVPVIIWKSPTDAGMGAWNDDIPWPPPNDDPSSRVKFLQAYVSNGRLDGVSSGRFSFYWDFDLDGSPDCRFGNISHSVPNPDCIAVLYVFDKVTGAVGACRVPMGKYDPDYQ